MKSVVYIDGQNFLYKAAEILMAYGKISDKQDLTSLDIRYIFEDMFPDDDLEIRYYGVAKIKRRYDLGEDILNKSIRFSDNLRRIRNSLSLQNIKYVEAGQLKIRDSDICKKCGSHDCRFREKGVDVSLAVGIVRDTLKSEVDKIILVSSDTDLIPAVLLARQEGKEVVYVGFDNKLTEAISSKVNFIKIIKDKTIIKSYNSNNS